jgi:hypothetical protein
MPIESAIDYAPVEYWLRSRQQVETWYGPYSNLARNLKFLEGIADELTRQQYTKHWNLYKTSFAGGSSFYNFLVFAYEEGLNVAEFE